jgi:hypothetical protein
MAIFNGTADQIENNVNKVAEITKANTNETNYPSTAAVVKIISEIDIPEVDLSGKMDKFGEVTETETERKIVLDEFSGVEGNTNAVIFESKNGSSQLKLTDSGEAYFKVANCIIKKGITGGNYWDLDNCGFRNVAAPEEENDAANKEYVDTIAKNTRDFIIPEKISDALTGVTYLENNKEYVPTNEVIAVQFDFPSENFICSLFFTTAPETEGDITIKFPTGTKFIGAKPTFGNNETWELNIKNGVVVGGKVE